MNFKQLVDRIKLLVIFKDHKTGEMKVTNARGYVNKRYKDKLVGGNNSWLCQGFKDRNGVMQWIPLYKAKRYDKFIYYTSVTKHHIVVRLELTAVTHMMEGINDYPWVMDMFPDDADFKIKTKHVECRIPRKYKSFHLVIPYGFYYLRKKPVEERKITITELVENTTPHYSIFPTYKGKLSNTDSLNKEYISGTKIVGDEEMYVISMNLKGNYNYRENDKLHHFHVDRKTSFIRRYELVNKPESSGQHHCELSYINNDW